MSSTVSDIGSVLLAVQQKLISASIFNRVDISLTPFRRDMPPDDCFAVICPARAVLDQRTCKGGGRVDMWIEGGFTLTVHCRLEQDQANTDITYLTDQALGALQKLKCCINALMMYAPVDINGNVLCPEPIRLISVDVPEHGKTIPGWGAVVSLWESNWQQDLSC